MRLVLVLLTTAGLLAAESFPVIHKKTGWPDGKGTVEITAGGVRFTAHKEKRSRQWGWLDIQHFDRLSETVFEILTYEDRRLYLGRDRAFRFAITEGKLTDRLLEEIARRLGRPVTNRSPEKAEAPRYEIQVKHRHPLGGCEGVLQFAGGRVLYLTDHAGDAREWLLERDVDSVWSRGKYDLELHVREHNQREFNRVRVFRFQLKQPLDRQFYHDLKLALHDLNG